MKKALIFLFFINFTLFFISASSSLPSFKNGEYLKYKIRYGLVNAGYATLTTKETTYSGVPHYHVVGEGYSTGSVKLFFKVEDHYESYINKSTLLPSKFIRKIKEGSYERDQTMTLDQSKKTLTYTNNKDNTSKNYSFKGDIHDIISAFYYLRNLNTDSYKTGDFITLNIFLDNETLNFKLKILGRENLKTSFGTIKSIKIRPYVLSGRVFKEKESVTMWISDDVNHVPLLIKASLMVGSLKAELSDYKNLPGSFN